MAGTCWAWWLHSYNLQYLHQQNIDVSDGMIHTADDASYIVPGYNFVKTGVWKDNSQGVSSYVQRPPLIGIINIGLLYLDGKEGNGLQKHFSLLLHFFSLLVFGLLARELLGKFTGTVIQIFYAAVPIFWGFLFYYISESITPSLFVFLLYGTVMFYKYKKQKWLIFQAAMVGCMLLIRPQLGIFLLPFLYSLFVWVQQKRERKWIPFIFSILIAFGGFSAWEIRAYTITHHLKLHPIYHVTNNSQYRPVHGSFTAFYKTWEHVSPTFHSHMISIWYLSKNPGEFDNNLNRIVSEIPPKVFKCIPESDFRDLFKRYHEVSFLIHPYEKNGLPVPGETVLESNLRKDVDQWTNVLKKKMWMENNFAVPLRSATWTFSKSQLNLKIFQTKFRGRWWMEIFRYTCVGMITIIALLSISHITNINHKIFWLMAMAIIGYLFYLFFIQKMNEERYLMPLLPIFLVLAAEKIQMIYRKARG